MTLGLGIAGVDLPMDHAHARLKSTFCGAVHCLGTPAIRFCSSAGQPKMRRKLLSGIDEIFS